MPSHDHGERAKRWVPQLRLRTLLIAVAVWAFVLGSGPVRKEWRLYQERLRESQVLEAVLADLTDSENSDNVNFGNIRGPAHEIMLDHRTQGMSGDPGMHFDY